MQLLGLEQVVSQVWEDVGVILDRSVVVFATGEILVQEMPKGRDRIFMAILLMTKHAI